MGRRIAEGVAVAGISPRHVIGAEFRKFVAGQPQNVCAGIQGYKIHVVPFQIHLTRSIFSL